MDDEAKGIRDGKSGRIVGFCGFRAGSKRLPKKNGLKLGEKTLYEITLDKLVRLKKIGLLDAVVASTDSPEWRKHCKEVYGEEVILHMRPESVSTDSSNTTEVILDFLKQHPEFKGSAVMAVLCVYPFLKSSVLENIARKHKETGSPVFAIVKSHHMPQKLLRIDDDGQVLRPYLLDRMQDFEENTKILLERHPVCVHTTGAYLLADAFDRLSKADLWHQDINYVWDDSFHVDIDTMDDFELAELRYAQKKAYV